MTASLYVATLNSSTLLPSNLARPHEVLADGTSFLVASGIAARPIVAFLELLLVSAPIQVAWVFVIGVAPNIRTLVHLLGPFAHCQLETAIFP